VVTLDVMKNNQSAVHRLLSGYRTERRTPVSTNVRLLRGFFATLQPGWGVSTVGRASGSVSG